MAERKGQIATANKIAMSKALGAAFLNHQVEQLEKTVSNGPASGNWRDRQTGRTAGYQASTPSPKAAQHLSAIPNGRRRNVEVITPTKSVTPKPRETRPAVERAAPSRRSTDDNNEKDADIIVVDSSVLVHALDYLKKWSRNGRQEIVIVPLEALNTLDLLKKGTTALAQRARAASRILEAQVGTNPRIRVQRDDAFVLWDKIPFDSTAENHDVDKSLNSSPEWVRRTICCARWEVDHATAELKSEKDAKPKVILAVCTGNQTLSPKASTLKPLDSTDIPLTPVPLPAPSIPHPNKHEPRSNGNLVAHWGSRAGVALLDVKPSPSIGQSGNPRSSSEDERPKRAPKGRRRNGSIDNGKGLVERSPAVLAMMEMVQHPTKVVRVLARGEKLDPDP